MAPELPKAKRRTHAINPGTTPMRNQMMATTPHPYFNPYQFTNMQYPYFMAMPSTLQPQAAYLNQPIPGHITSVQVPPLPPSTNPNMLQPSNPITQQQQVVHQTTKIE